MVTWIDSNNAIEESLNMREKMTTLSVHDNEVISSAFKKFYIVQ